MPRTPEQFEKIREEKRNHIMEVALECFANEGYHSTSISKIAKSAGISKGLIYNYFELNEDYEDFLCLTMAARPCVDCRVLGANIKPIWWEESP